MGNSPARIGNAELCPFDTRSPHFADQRRPAHAQPNDRAVLTSDHAFCMFENLNDVRTLHLF
jgi:hypothetical protein